MPRWPAPAGVSIVPGLAVFLGWGSAAAGLRQCMRWPMLDCVRTAGCGASRALRGAVLVKAVLVKHGWASALLLALVLPGCTVGPDYSREPAPVPTTYKELKGWKHATPSDDLPRGDWWAPYRDPRLDTLLRQVEISNQTVAAAAAAYEQSRAIIRESQAALFPTATASYGVTRTRTGALAGTTGGSAVGASLRTRYTTQYSAPINGGWDLDVWGKVRAQIESDASAAQASAADLDNAKLSAQAQLAIAYFNLLAADSLRDLLQPHRRRISGRPIDITLNKYNAGYGPSGTDGDDQRRRRAGPGAGSENIEVAGPQCRHPARAIRACHRGADRPAAGGTHDRARSTFRQNSENSGRGTLGDCWNGVPISRPRSAPCSSNNALIGVAEAAYFPDVSLSAMVQFIGPIPLPFSAARSIRRDRRQRHANSVQRRADRRSGRRRARRPIGKASPLIGRRC